MSQNKPEAEIRLDKLNELKKLGINPYPSRTPSFHAIGEVRKKKEGEKTATVGRITAIREHGKSTFFDIEDPEEKLQVYFKLDEVGEKSYELLKLLDVGDYVWISGEMFITKAGELSLKAKEFQLLSKSLLPIPEGWHGLTDVETRYRSRSLDFKINKSTREIIKTRSNIISGIRDFLDRHGFIEITTPVLQPIPGGATARPFITHHNALDADFYLRVSDELYLKRLVVGGFERVYEIGPDFRNEGLSHMHNPEFTMCEFYWAYQTAEGLRGVTQKLVQELVEKTNGTLTIEYQGHKLDFSGDFVVKKYRDLIEEETGINIDTENDFKKLNAAVKAKTIEFKGQDIKVWSELVDELFKKTCRPKIVQPTFVIDYPIATAPLAKRYEDRPETAQKFQLIVAGGFELVNAYSELNDPLDQEARFREQMEMREEGWDEAQMLDENYIEALKFGMPPTAGWGMGIDRMTMILTNQYSIKEVIPFPTLKPIKNIGEEKTK
jgi:lysyl-tRNA synthetase, class II